MYLDTLKAQQALQVLRQAHRQETVTPARLLMLLYLSERESWRARRKPLLASRIVASKLMGPVHSLASSISKDAAPSNLIPSELADAEITILREITETHAHQSELEILDITTNLPEWAGLRSKDFGAEIPYKVILGSLGFETDEIQEVLASFPILTMEED